MRKMKKRGRRDWVKNALIAFLSIMLVLTFFSNTIMNYSLPEVAAQYPSATTLTTKIRGTGTVEAAQSYNVVLNETRTVESVSVKAGDTIAAGDVLFTLEKTESQELTEARSAYAALKLEYEKATLDKGDQNNAAETSLQQLRNDVANAETDLANAQDYEETLRWHQSQVDSAQEDLGRKQTAQAQADAAVSALQGQIANAENSNADYLSAKHRAEGGDTEAAAETQRIYDEEIAPTIASLTADLTAAQGTAATAAADVTAASSALTEANSALSRFQSSYTGPTVSAAETALAAAKSALATAEATAADTAAEKTYTDAVEALDLADLERRLGEAEDEVKRLEEKTAAIEIVSNHAGIIAEVNVAAGDSTTPDTSLVVVDMTEKGYSLKATVTKDQARTLTTGLTAEIINLWNSDIVMTLDSITTASTDPSGSRDLTFSVVGEDVAVGDTLSFSIGDKNSSYDIVIPTAAIHTDADGSFVYTVSVKSSPLGNRYTVKKKSVTILASDEVNSAVSGELSTADFVITTSTVPLEVGDQVRIAE